MKLGVIYKATNLINGKAYIGQTINFQERKAAHLNPNCPHKYAFQRAIQKYGKNAFKWEILEDNIPQELLNEREIYWIAYYDTYGPQGYNLTIGGDNNGQLQKWSLEHPEERLEYIKKANEATSKPVLCVELDLIFPSTAAAERWSKSSDNPNGKTAHHSHIGRVCRGERQTCGGYHWKFVNKN